MTKNIVLMGYRGSGKTHTARYLAKKLGRRIISTDKEIEKIVGEIGIFVKKNGWKKFRDIESKVIESIHKDDLIIDCGGGFVERERNVKNLKKNGVIIWLKTRPEQIKERIKGSKERPSLTGTKSFLEEIEEVLEKRTPLYKKAADYEIDTGNKPVEQVGNEILKLIKMKTEVCIPITAVTAEEAIKDMKHAEKLADLVELRIDFIKNIDENKLEKLLKSKKKKIIVTCRPKNLCGNFEGSEKERIKLLKKSIELNVDYIDIEMESNNKEIKDMINNKKNSKIIVSHHNLKETPSLKELNNKYNEIKKLNPDLIKIVTTANSINDNFAMFSLLENKNDLIAFCMGIRGQISRILAPKYGSRITFASLEEGKESASGQISIEEMKNVYNINLINNETKAVGVIGEFAENSMSKYMHNASFKEKKLNFVYMPFKAKKQELKEFINNFKKFSFAGASVTIPHKVEVMKCLDKIDETAKQIGAVNTIASSNGKLIGYNTDCYGAVEALKEKTKLKDKKVLVVGAGGGARAVVYGLKNENSRVTIINRTTEKAKILAKEFNVKFDGMENIKQLVKNNEIMINTTSVGMAPNTNESIINGNDLIKGKIVMDIVYKPIETKLIKLAKKAGCKVITGDRMLVYQAIRPFKLWTNHNPDFKLMESALEKHIYSKGHNIMKIRGIFRTPKMHSIFA